MDLFHLIGETICHQNPDRCFWLDGSPFFVCGRCTGIYLGFLLSYLHLAGRRRFLASSLPTGFTRWFLLLLMALTPLNVALIVLFKFDGGNSSRFILGYLLGMAAPFFLQPLVMGKLTSSDQQFSFEGTIDYIIALGVCVAGFIFFDGLPNYAPLWAYEIITLIGILLFYAVLNILVISYLFLAGEKMISFKNWPLLYLFGLGLSIIEIYFSHFYQGVLQRFL